MAQNAWYENTYLRYRNLTYYLYEHCREGYITMRNECKTEFFNRTGHSFDPTGRLDAAIERFGKAVTRLNALYPAMDSYLDSYNLMLANSQSTMESVAVENTVYGSFAGLVTAGTVSAANAYAHSTAYQFYTEGYDFSIHYNHVEQFMEEGTWFYEKLSAVSHLKDWKELSLQVLLNHDGTHSTQFAENLQESALLSALSNIPWYSEETESFDWGALGKKMGMPGIGKGIEKFLKWCSSITKNIDYDELEQKYYECLSPYFTGSPEKRKLLEKILKSEGFVNLFGILTKIGFSVGEIGQFLTNIVYHLCSNHEYQVSYLESIQETLTTSGHLSGPVQAMLDEMIIELENAELYVIDQIGEKLGGKLTGAVGDLFDDAIDDLIKETISETCSIGTIAESFSITKNVDLTLSLISDTTTLLAGDEIKAFETLQGLQMYTPALIDSYEKYMELIDLGIASTEDVDNAKNLFDLIRASKIQEYKCIKTLSEEGSEWYEIAEEKIRELDQWCMLRPDYALNNK